MPVHNENELLHQLTSLRPSGDSTPNTDHLDPSRATELLRIAFEVEADSGRRIASKRAARTWRSLPTESQSKYIRLLSGTWNHHLIAGRVGRAARIAKFLKKTGTSTARPEMEAEGLLALGICRLAEGDAQGAVRLLDLSRATYQSTGSNTHDVVRASLPLAAALRLDSDRRSARAVLERARGLCLVIEDAPMLAGVSINLGALAIESGEFLTAMESYQFATRASELIGSRKRALRGTLGLAMVSLRQGDGIAAESYAKKALAESVETAAAERTGPSFGISRGRPCVTWR